MKTYSPPIAQDRSSVNEFLQDVFGSGRDIALPECSDRGKHRCSPGWEEEKENS